MFRDYKFLRRNSQSSKNPNAEEIENVPLNPRHSLGPQISSDPMRPPLNTIQEPKGKVAQEGGGGKVTKIDRTPTKPKAGFSDSTVPHRTPEKHGTSSKYRFGWAQKGDTSSNNGELREQGRGDVSSNVGLSRTMGNMMTTPRSARRIGRANSSFSECNSTQTTPTKSVSKPPNPGLCLTNGGSRALVYGGARMPNSTVMSKGTPNSFNSSSVVNKVEVPYFELKEDPAFWMDHSVQVLMRVRPLNSMEKSSNGFNRCLKQESAQCITWIGQPETRFTFDHIACETIDQETIFRVVGLPIVENCLSGYNSCMFAYGQTGSGKTYTMLGDTEELEVRPSPDRGLTPRIFEFLFARIRAEEDSRKDETLKYNCKCSFLEIYNEQITDLLDPSSTNLQLREDIKKGVYVENLSELEVQSVGDILKLLRQGSSNRKVAATNMNSESSRSHSVFTCVVESRWEKDSTSNFRFARLNLVDLAGSERQKTSGAEGERLKEAANINKSLSTLGHVIMVLVDVAHGKSKHVPYRDSKLTFLLQDSLGGNSKTTIIANVSPSVCCAAETLNTLKFAQRVKLIQNNAVVNEDSSGDVVALQHQIRKLKEELVAIKRQNVSRALSFGSETTRDLKEEDNYCTGKASQMDQQDNLLEKHSDCILRLSSKQLKSLETTLSGAFRREQMAETAIKQLEAEIEQLNRLVRQREEDTRCSKMMLKFREDKIQRMESLIEGLIPPDTYLVEENNALSEEVQLLRDKVDKNPEVTRFALEYNRLSEQLQRFQDFYEEGEREILLAEISELRNQLTSSFDGSLKHQDQLDVNLPSHVSDLAKENDLLRLQLKETLRELDESRNNLNFCLEKNAKLRREIDDLSVSVTWIRAPTCDGDSDKVINESNLEACTFDNQSMTTFQNEKSETRNEYVKMKHTGEVLDLQLELDILKIILREEKSYRCDAEERTFILNRDLELSKEKILLVNNQYADIQEELKQAQSVIEALESQQILLIEEIEDLKKSDRHYKELMCNLEREITSLKEQIRRQESRDLASKLSESESSPLQAKLRKMHDSLEKAKQLNQRYQTDLAFQESNEEEMDEIRRQVEAETAEVIVCLQEELANLQQEVQDSKVKEMETRESLELVQVERKKLEEEIYLMSQANRKLNEILEDKEQQLETNYEEWKVLTSEIESILAGGQESLEDATDQLDDISSSLSHKESWVSQQFSRIRKYITEKELTIEELNQWLEDVMDRRNDMDCMLRSLRGAALVMTEAHQQECTERDKEILRLTSELSAKTSALTELEKTIKQGEDELRKTSNCATVAFVVVKRLSELNCCYLEKLSHMDLAISGLTETNMQKDAVLRSQASAIDEAEKQNVSLKVELQGLKEAKVEDEENKILSTREKLVELRTGISTVRSCMNEYEKWIESPEKGNDSGTLACVPAGDTCENRTGTQEEYINQIVQCIAEDNIAQCTSPSSEIAKSVNQSLGNQRKMACERVFMDEKDKNATIILLKKEMECALESLKGVQAEMARLRAEKEEAWMSEKESRERIKSLMTQVLALQIALDRSRDEFDQKVSDLNKKLQVVNLLAEQSGESWLQQKELLEAELDDAKVLANQKATEAACILAKFEEAQDTMKEADVMIKELIIANEALKLDKKDLKKKELKSSKEREALKNEVESLQAASYLKDLHCEQLEIQFEEDLVSLKTLLVELEYMVAEIQTTSMEKSMLLASEVVDLKSQCCRSTVLVRSWLEDIWSEIITKDCALSVLHLCHLGILLETVTGLNAENGLLHHGLCESNSVISELREHNIKSRQELEMCRTVKGKLLIDIRNSFDRISKKEHETEELSVKLTSFDKKISDLQFQEELMLQKSNHIGSELAALMTELDKSNRNVIASLLEQERLQMEKEELWISQEENLIVEQTSKDLELLILSMELEETTKHFEVLENFKKNIFICSVDAAISESISVEKEVELSLLKQEAKEAEREKQELLLELNKRESIITQMGKLKETLEQDIQSLNKVAHSNNILKHDVDEVMEAKALLSSHVQKLESDYQKLLEELKMKESTHEQNQLLQESICFLETESSRLQNELEMKDSELGVLSCIEEENKVLHNTVNELKEDHRALLQQLEDKKSELDKSSNNTTFLDKENHTLQEKIYLLESRISNLQTDLIRAKEEGDAAQLCQSLAKDDIQSKCQTLQIQIDRVNTLKEENAVLRNEIRADENNKRECLKALNMNIVKCVNSAKDVDDTCSRILYMFSEKSVAWEDALQRICNDAERTFLKFTEELESVENLAAELVSENSSLQNELVRKDEILKGLLFDLSLLQERTSNTMDKDDEIEQLEASLNVLENDFELKSRDLDDAVAKSQVLEAQLLEKKDIISALELDISKVREMIKSLSNQNVELVAGIENALKANKLMEEELEETREARSNLEMQLARMDISLSEMTNSIESLKSDLAVVTDEREDLSARILILKKELAMAQAVAEESEAIAAEAQEIAETKRVHAENKDEEVKLLERSIEELEYTVNVMENKVEIIKGEAEKQRLQREELELELHAVKQQMHNLESSDNDVNRLLDEKEKHLQEAFQRIQILEREISAKDVEINQCKAHISELYLHAEAQASEYKQKIKALEAMAEQVKQDVPATTHSSNSSSGKLEKNPSKSRGSSSPFKCIGGLVHQIKSEREEELSAGRHRIEELEALAASRQKEIFMLNARLAAAESMTHDVIRDLLGLKLDMNSYANLLDNQQVQMLTEKPQLQKVEGQVKEQEIYKLKQQLSEFIQERKGWLEEIDRKQAEVVAAQVALEKLRQRDRLLSAENDMLKMENATNKKRVMELEAEVKKLSGQQNLQQRIHHHAKIKDENNALKNQNDDLTFKLRRTEAILTRVREELAQFRQANGRCSYINFDEEQRLGDKLKEVEEEKLQLAQKLLSLCTSILKVAGITKPKSEISLPVAEEALEQLKNTIFSLEREVQDQKFKNRMNNERIRLSELMPQSSPLSSRGDDNCRTPKRVSQTSFLSPLDR